MCRDFLAERFVEYRIPWTCVGRQLLLEIHGVDINASNNLSDIPILMFLYKIHLEVTHLPIDMG